MDELKKQLIKNAAKDVMKYCIHGRIQEYSFKGLCKVEKHYIINNTMEIIKMFSMPSENLDEYNRDYVYSELLNQVVNDKSILRKMVDESGLKLNNSCIAIRPGAKFSEMSTERGRKAYVDMYIDNNTWLCYDSFVWCSDELRLRYITELDYVILDDDQFRICSNYLKRMYIDRVVGNMTTLTNVQFGLCSEELKIYYIERLISVGNDVCVIDLYLPYYRQLQIKDILNG